jgi:glutamine cyclotransferase
MKERMRQNRLSKCFMFLMIIMAAFITFLSLSPPSAPQPRPIEAAENIPYKIINTYPHPPGSFTQGLAYENGFLYEGTGQYGLSCLRKIKYETGEILKEYRLPRDVFGEGITIFKNKIIQLTWLSHVGFVFDKESFRLLKTFRYEWPKEGWGLTSDGNDLIISDGSPKLYFMDPESFTERKRLEVYDNLGPVYKINELEYVEGDIYANIWQLPRIIRIDLQTGKVTGALDLSELIPKNLRGHVDYVLNGIAYDPKKQRFFVTGKMWPLVFELELLISE